jgi:hypothetical protein
MKYYDMKSLEKQCANHEEDDEDMLFGNMENMKDSSGSSSYSGSGYANKHITQYAYWNKKIP